MSEVYVYHVVTDMPLSVGQILIFDDEIHNGVYTRVMSKLSIIEDIYKHPQQYNIENLEHHTRVALRELALEKIRQKEYPAYPSRMGCLYVSKTIEEAEKWAQLFIAWGRPTYSIVKLKVTGSIFTGDANNCFDATTDETANLALARHYWKNLPNAQGEPPIKEILANGKLQVIQILKELNQNM